MVLSLHSALSLAFDMYLLWVLGVGCAYALFGFGPLDLFRSPMRITQKRRYGWEESGIWVDTGNIQNISSQRFASFVACLDRQRLACARGTIMEAMVAQNQP